MHAVNEAGRLSHVSALHYLRGFVQYTYPMTALDLADGTGEICSILQRTSSGFDAAILSPSLKYLGKVPRPISFR